MQVAEARRATRPTWLNLRTVLGAILFAVSLLCGSIVLGAADEGVLVWAVSRDLPEGAALTAGDLQVVEVELPPGQSSSYLGGTVALEGSILLRPVRAGELLAAAWVGEKASTTARSIAVPIDAEHAVGGVLRPGDRVDIFATFQRAGGEAMTKLLVQNAEVEGLLRTEALVMDRETFAGITVSVPSEEAARIAFALRSSEIDVVRVEGLGDIGPVSSITARDL